jgi:hypothetical protein
MNIESGLFDDLNDFEATLHSLVSRGLVIASSDRGLNQKYSVTFNARSYLKNTGPDAIVWRRAALALMCHSFPEDTILEPW